MANRKLDPQMLQHFCNDYLQNSGKVKFSKIPLYDKMELKKAFYAGAAAGLIVFKDSELKSLPPSAKLKIGAMRREMVEYWENVNKREQNLKVKKKE